MRKLSTDSGKNVGVLTYIIESSVLQNIIGGAKFGEGSRVHLFTEDWDIIASLDKKQIGQQYNAFDYMEKANEYRVEDNNLLTYTTTKNGWKLASIIPVNTLMGEIYQVGKNSVALGVICVIIAIIMSIFISIGISKPFSRTYELNEQSGKWRFDSNFRS